MCQLSIEISSFNKQIRKMSNKFRLFFDGDRFDAENIVKTTEKLNSANKIVEINEKDKILNEFNDCFLDCLHKVNKMNIKHSDKDTIINICIELINGTTDLTKKMIAISECEEDSIDLASSYVVKNLKSVSTRRLRENKLKELVAYVAPQEKSIGTKWRSQKKFDSDLTSYQIVQSTFQYMDIVKTLESVFAQPLFVKTYFDFNEQHNCVIKQLQCICSLHRKEICHKRTLFPFDLEIRARKP